jgi:hypothetical protein
MEGGDMKRKQVKTIIKFHYSISNGTTGFRVEIFAQNEKDAERKLSKLLRSGFDSKLEKVEEIIP